jgi:hypothetical protein
MTRIVRPLLGVVLMSLVAWAGCKETEAPQTAPDKNPAPEGAPAADAGDAAAQQEELAAMAGEEATAVSAELAKMSAEERAVVEAQQLCPVSGEALGSMGPPIKVTVDGKDKPIYVCCKGCVDAVKSDYDAVLAKVEKNNAPAN